MRRVEPARSRSTCAVVASPLANLYAAPDHRAELKSQRLHGELVQVSARRGPWLLASGWDGYRGWVRSWSLLPLTETAARRWARAACACAWAPAVAVRAAPAPAARVLTLLPWGSRLVLLGACGPGWVGVELPGDRIGYVRARELGPPRGLSAARDRGQGAAALALSQCGASYLWGGASSWGFDCSGLVQWAYALLGRALPRDARDQIRMARPLARHESPRSGDLLFFGRDGGVSHVAILTRPPRFVHAYGRVEEATLSGPGPLARPELRAISLGPHRLR